MGHVQRSFEEAGIPCVSVYVRAFAHIPKLMGLSRTLITDHPMGRPLGAPRDRDRQLEVVATALELLDSDVQSLAEFGEPYRTY